jgi:hypothetical protein
VGGKLTDERRAAENAHAIPALPLGNRYLNGGYGYEYVEPAILTDYEVQELLGMWGDNTSDYRLLHHLLVTAKNHPTVATELIQAMRLRETPNLDNYRTNFNTRCSQIGRLVRMVATSPRGYGGRRVLEKVEFQVWRVRKRPTPL